MIKKSLVFLLLLFFFNVAFATPFQNVPFGFRNYFPQDNGIVKPAGFFGKEQNFIDTGIAGSNTQLYNTLTLRAGSLTPGYSPQIFTIIPEDINGTFSNITLHIRNLEYLKKWKGKLRPVITIEYRDVNNSPIYTSYNTINGPFNPWDYSLYGMNPQDFTSTKPSNGVWYGKDKFWNMDIKLPMNYLSFRDKANISIGSAVDSNRYQAKLKYIKVKFSLASLEQPNGKSYLSCTQFRKSNLVDEKYGYFSFGGAPATVTSNISNINSYLGLGVKPFASDYNNLYFFNGLKYRSISPITLDLVKPDGKVKLNTSNRALFQTKIAAQERKINDFNNATYYNSGTTIKRPGETLGMEANPYKSILGYKNIMYDYKKSFLIDDCVALRIKPSSNPAQDRNPIGVNGNVTRVPYGAGLGFSFIPMGVKNDFTGVQSSFKYNIGVSGTPPQVSSALAAEVNKLQPPKISSSVANYDWKNEKPIISKRSFSAGLKQKEIDRIRRLAKNYCNFLYKTTPSKRDPCLNMLGYNGAIKVNVGDPDYTPVLNPYSPLYSDNFGSPKDRQKIKQVFNGVRLVDTIIPLYPANKDAKGFVEFEKIMKLLKTNDTEAGHYMYFDNFLSVVPSTTTTLWSKIAETKKTLEEVDQSFQWQTLMPKEKTAYEKVAYNISLLKGNKYLYFGTYDLDSNTNGGIPSVPISIDFRLENINSDRAISDPTYVDVGPIAIKIDGKFDKKALVTDKQKIQKIYVNTNDQKGSTNSLPAKFGLPGSTGSIIDNRKNIAYGKNYTTYKIPGPEGNDKTTFYKFDLMKLKGILEKQWDGDQTKLKYLKQWQFDTTNSGALKNNIYMRLVINNPQTKKTNIIYTISNTAIGLVNPALPEGPQTGYNLQLIDVTKDLGTQTVGDVSLNVKYNTGNLLSTNGPTYTSDNKVAFGFRLSTTNDFTNEIINPYLLFNNLPYISNNLKNITFTGSELTNFVEKTRQIDPSETIVDSSTIKVGGINYKKTCIEIGNPNSPSYQQIANKQGGTDLKNVLLQNVCYYVKMNNGIPLISKIDLINNPNLRVLAGTGISLNDNMLPYVDIYINYRVQDNNNLKAQTYSFYHYEILNTTNSPVNIFKANSITPGAWTFSPAKRDFPMYFSKMINSANINNALTNYNKGKLWEETPSSKFSLTDFGNDGKDPKKRISLPFFVYFDKIKDHGKTYLYNEVKEYNKYNNTSIVVKGYIDNKVTNTQKIKLTWDYLKIDQDNNQTVIPNPIDYPKAPPTNQKKIGDVVKVYPKIINEGSQAICDLQVGFDIISGISSKIDINSQNIDNVNIPFISSSNPLLGSTNTNSGKTIWLSGDFTRDLTANKLFQYNYILNNVNNSYSYKVRYKYCGELSNPYKTKVSPVISFNVKPDPLVTPNAVGAGICNLNNTTPITGSNVRRGQNIDYKIYCKNITNKDIYDLEVQLPTPDGIRYVNGIKDTWVKLGSLAQNEVISFDTNPLDMIKNTKVGEFAYLNQILIGRLNYRYKQNPKDTIFLTDWDEINHKVILSNEDTIIIKTLRGSCNARNEYTAQNPPIYPFSPSAGMCLAKLNSTDKNGNVIDTQDNKACLVVKYYRIGKDLLINDAPKQNNDPQLSWGRTTNNNQLGGQCSYLNSTAGGEGQMRSKYVNVRVKTDIQLPSGFALDGNALAYTDYTAQVNNIINTPLTGNKYRFTTTLNSNGESEFIVKNNNFQKVLRDGTSDSRNANKFTAALVELRIPLKAISKGSGQSGNKTNFKGEVVTDNMKIVVDNSDITYDRKRWERFDQASYCDIICGKKSCSPWFIRNDGTSVERFNGFTFDQKFTLAIPNEEPVCVSSPGAWIQVLNGGMYVKDLSNLKNIEHAVDPNVPTSYNTNWFYNQGSTTLKPTGFVGSDGGANDIFNFDNKFVTKQCYPYLEATAEYDYTKPYKPTFANNRCLDGKKPWFYSIIDGDYGFLYEFTKPQLKTILNGTLDLDRGSDSYDIRDRVWLYEERKYGEPLVIGKAGVKDVKIKGLGSIFVTNDITNLDDKTATLNINSNITYANNVIYSGKKYGEVKGDGLAVVINGNLKIGSKVEKLEGIYFVDGDVYIEDGKNTLEIDKLYITGNLYIKRGSTTNSQIDRFTRTQERPVFRATGGKGRYYFIQPKIMKNRNTYYKEVEVPANNLNLDCEKLGGCQ